MEYHNPFEFPCNRYNNKGKETETKQMKMHTQGIVDLMDFGLLEKFVFYLQSFQSHH